MIELRGVSKTYGATVALYPLDLRIEPGRTTALIGPSGCGKSTLLRLMSGLVEPDAGSVWFDGVELTPRNLLECRRRIGYVIQEGGLFDHLTAGGNVSLMARFLSWPVSRIEQRTRELADLVQLPVEMLSRYPLELSGGQRQRVSLMRALMLDPAVLLLDEPLGALDPLVRHDLQTELKRIFATLNKTVVLVTHDMGEAAFLAEDIVLMRAGRVVQRGTIGQLLERPAEEFVPRFIHAHREAMDAVRPHSDGQANVS